MTYKGAVTRRLRMDEKLTTRDNITPATGAHKLLIYTTNIVTVTCQYVPSNIDSRSSLNARVITNFKIQYHKILVGFPSL